MANKSENSENISKALILLALLALLIAVGVLLMKSKGKLRNKADVSGIVPADSAMVRNLTGVYDVSFSTEDDFEAATAEILPGEEGEYELITVNEYGPKTYTLKIEGLKLLSEELGEGSVEYKKSIDKITITFTKGGEICTLTK